MAKPTSGWGREYFAKTERLERTLEELERRNGSATVPAVAHPVSRCPMAKFARGLPLLGNSLQFLGDTTRLLVSNYRQHGPIFRLRVLWLKFTVILGFEAKQFMIDGRERHLTRRPVFDPVGRQLEQKNFALALSGEDHMQLRHLLLLAYSREVASQHVPDFIRVVRDALREWKPGSVREVFETVQYLAFLQYARVMGNVSWKENYKDMRAVTDMNMDVGGRVLPLWMYHWPPYRRARKRMLSLMAEMVKTRRAGMTRGNRPPDILDTLLSLKFPDGRTMNDQDVGCYAFYGFAGSSNYMARLVSFMLYEILRDPQLYRRLKDEVDRAFVRGICNASDVAELRLLRGIFYETLRFHPVSQGMPYVAAEDFEFNGYRVEKGQMVVLSQLPMLFASPPFREPEKYDPERCMEPRNEHRKGGAFNPFGIHHRMCAAMGLVELMTITMVATLVREVELEMSPSDYRLKKIAKPLPAPTRAFRMRTQRRQTITEQPLTKTQTSEEICLATFPGADKPEVVQALREGEHKEFASGAMIIKQNDVADAFYVLISGRVEVIPTDAHGREQDPIPLGPGAYFGEIGLIHNVPRTATVRVTRDGPASTFVLSAAAFRKIIAASDMISDEISRVMHKRVALNQIHERIRESSIEQLSSLFPGFESAHFQRGQTIIRENDPSDAFYILCHGDVVVSHDRRDSSEHVATLHPGDCFGEIGLLHNVPRTATVKAGTSEVVTLKCDRDVFNQLVTNSDGKRDLALALITKLQLSAN